MIPRVSGYDPGITQGTFGIEKRAGGHSFQINVSNAFGTTMGQLARGGFSNDDWYLGFSISRKFLVSHSGPGCSSFCGLHPHSGGLRRR
jgi:hypothetical protein